MCNGEKREYTSKKSGNLKITRTQKDNVNNIITDLSNSTNLPNLLSENALLFQTFTTSLVSAIDFSADVFIEDMTSITAIELKSVRPNSGETRGEKQKILEGKAALHNLFPGKEIKFYLGFPFDPTLDPTIEPVTSFHKSRFLGNIINMNKYFAPNETLVASELWDMLSGETNTMEEILEIINSISSISFLDKFRLLNDNSKRTSPDYIAQLIEWNLFSEIELIKKNGLILRKIGTNAGLNRIYNKMAFDSKGNYNTDRYNELITIL